MGKKNTETAESGEKERGCIFLCARMNVHDHVHLMKKASKEDREVKTKRISQKESSLRLQSVLPTLLFQGTHVTRCGPRTSVFMLLAHLKTPHISRRAFAEGRGVKISSTRKNLLGRISRYFLLLFCSSQSLMELFKWRTSWHITTAACTAITSF